MRKSTRRALRGAVAMAILFVLGFIIACQTEQTMIGDISVILGLIIGVYLFFNVVLFYKDIEDEDTYNDDNNKQ